MQENMTSSLELARNNLSSVPVLVFILGFIAARIKSDVRLPDQVYQFISIYLLFGIGLKGGYSLQGASLSEVLAPSIATVVLGCIIPAVAFATLKFIKRLNEIDRGAIAAHYGSTSLVTFSAALIFLENSGISFEGYATALLTIMEIPGIIIGIYLGARHRPIKVSWSETLHEVLTGKTVMLLVGGLFIGMLTTQTGYETVSPFFIGLLNGILALFLMHLGFVAGSNWNEIKEVGLPMAAFAILFPVFAGVIGIIGGNLVGLSIGGAVVLAVLCASASYIAAPAAVSVALPEAKASLALVSSIGVTFPFNLIIGIPLYVELAKLFS